MKNKFLEAFYSLDDYEANRQLGVFLEIVKINLNGIELTQAGTKKVIELVNDLNTKIKSYESMHKDEEQKEV